MLLGGGLFVKKGLISLATMVGYVIVFVIYVVGFYPIIQTTIQNATNVDPLSASLMALVPGAFFVAMIVGFFNYALGRKPAGAWGGG